MELKNQKETSQIIEDKDFGHGITTTIIYIHKVVMKMTSCMVCGCFMTKLANWLNMVNMKMERKRDSGFMITKRTQKLFIIKKIEKCNLKDSKNNKKNK